MGRLQPVILSGGAGTRLWPLSRALYPKQLLALTGEHTQLQETALRVADTERFAPPVLVCNDEHRFAVAEQLREIGVEPARMILEPEGRNTAPAIALAAAALDPADVLLVLPSDHAIKKPKAFLAAVNKGAKAAALDRLVTFGVPASRPETGYGYLRAGPALEGAPGVLELAEFIEKPDETAASLFVSGGRHYWNSGILLFRAGAFLDELKALAPRIRTACEQAVAGGVEDLDFFRPASEPFAKAPAQSIDYAVMEKSARAAVVPADMGWSDVGSFEALWEVEKKDKAGNVSRGPVVLAEMENSFIHSDGRLVAAIGLSDIIIVATDDAVLAVPRRRAQDVGTLVRAARKQGRDESDAHSWVHRPWGRYQVIDEGEGFKAKRLTVKPGQALSLQKHEKRAEHWVVVAGIATVTRGEEVIELGPNQSTYIPAGMPHRLENAGAEELRLIEVQSGSYLGEDDIIRLEDRWNRG